MTTTSLTRRQLLGGMAAALGMASAFGATIGRNLLHPGIAEAAMGTSLPSATPILVLVELAGGCDLLNVHVPMADPAATPYYRAARRGLAITRLTTQRPYGPPPANDYLPPALDLDGQWALHGALPWLANRWHDKGDVAIVQGTGENVVQEMSHFAAFAYRWAGAFTGPMLNTGWLGRYNDAIQNTQPLGAISLGGTHQALTGLTSTSVAISDLATFGFNVMNVADTTAWKNQLYAMADPAAAGLNKASLAAQRLDAARAAVTQAAGVTRLPSSGAAGSLAQQLSTAASLIAAGIPCQTYVATLGAFDTHSSEPYNLHERLALLNDGLQQFFTLIDATSRAGDVFVLIHSEFGRQVSQNAGMGTDHGQASSMIFVGGGVKRGRYGAMPSLAPAARSFDSLVATVDFRSAYATALNRLGRDAALTDTVLGTDAAGRSFADLGVFGSGGPPPPSTTTTAPTTTTSPSTTTTTTTRETTTTTRPTTTTTARSTTTTTTTTTKRQTTSTTRR